MKSIHVPVHFDESFDIFTGHGILNYIPQHLVENPLGNRYKIFVSNSVADLYGRPLYEGMKECGLNVTVEACEDGEEIKRIEIVTEIGRILHREGFDRKDCAIIVSGGSLTDTIGFVAGTYKRGCNYINVPTTFIGQTDAGIGGKTGVNDESGKNMMGMFYNPRRVYNDTGLLVSLPDPEITNGMGEVIKYWLGFHSDMREYLERNRDKIFGHDQEAYEFIVSESSAIKANIVRQDPRETKDIRTCLNLGHTGAHGIEKATNYKLSHGLAVGLGLLVASRISVNRRWMKGSELERTSALLDQYGLPTKLDLEKYPVTRDDIIAPMIHDKKAVSGVINFVLLTGIGSLKKNNNGGYSNPATPQEIYKALDVIF